MDIDQMGNHVFFVRGNRYDEFYVLEIATNAIGYKPVLIDSDTEFNNLFWLPIHFASIERKRIMNRDAHIYKLRTAEEVKNLIRTASVLKGTKI